MSEGSLRDLCHLVGISPKTSCTLVRVLRAFHLSRVSGRMDPWEWLEIADARAREHLLDESGLRDIGSACLDRVLRTQRIVQDDTALALLSRALRRQGFLRSSG